MNPRMNTFSGFAGDCPDGSTLVVDPFGSGLTICMPTGGTPVPTPSQQSGCPQGQIGWPPLGVPCTQIPGQPQSAPPSAAPQCPDGQIGWPSMGLPCIAVPNAPQSAPPAAMNACPPGQIGWPPAVPCMSIPVLPAAPGTIPQPSIPGVVPTPVPPPPAPAPSSPLPAVAAGGKTPGWVMPVAVGVGAVALVVLLSKPRRARANRRRR